MRLLQGLSRLLLLFPFSAALLVCSNSASGQVGDTGVGGAGLQILQGLSPEQRQAISQQLGGGATGTPGARSLQVPDEEQQNLVRQQQRQVLTDMQRQRAELDRLSPFLRADDWVVITIDVNPLPGLPASPLPAGALGALSNLPSGT